jgi:hypothetical protein
VSINGQELQRRDGLGIWDVDALDVKVGKAARLLLMEVPMSL